MPWNDVRINGFLASTIMVVMIMTFILATILLIQSPETTSFSTMLVRYLPIGFWALVGYQLYRCARGHQLYICENCGASSQTHGTYSD